MRGQGWGSGDGWSVRTQLVAIVGVVTVLIVGAGAWLALVSMQDAEQDARRGVTFQAGLAADAIADALSQGESAMAGLASGFPVAALEADPSKCQLTFSDLGVFPVGHIDIVLPDGRVPCSSIVERGAPPGATQAGAGWLTSARTARQPGVAGVFTDRLSGQQRRSLSPRPSRRREGSPAAFAALVLPLAGPWRQVSPASTAARSTSRSPSAARMGPARRRTRNGVNGGAIVGQTRCRASAGSCPRSSPASVALAATRTAFPRLAALGGRRVRPAVGTAGRGEPPHRSSAAPPDRRRRPGRPAGHPRPCSRERTRRGPAARPRVQRR